MISAALLTLTGNHTGWPLNGLILGEATSRKPYRNDSNSNRLFRGIYFCRSILPYCLRARNCTQRSGGAQNNLSGRALGGYLPGEHIVRSLFCDLSGGRKSAWRTTFRGEAWYPYGEWSHS